MARTVQIVEMPPQPSLLVCVTNECMMSPRLRLRDLGITIGALPTGPLNAITDVPGVWVGHATVIRDEPRIARTGVTVIVPREGHIARDHVFAGYHSFNGCGEMTGLHWVEESGMLTSPIALTGTAQVGSVRDALPKYALARHGRGGYYLGVVGETWDGWLSDRDGFALTDEDVFAALDAAGPGPVAEGCVGGGTGMICCDFKAGIGTASRVVSVDGTYVVGVLVQANHGDRHELRVDGVPVGRQIGFDRAPSPWEERPPGSSLLVVIATDAPLLPVQCKRLARRATVGAARVGGIGHTGSGDLFLAFATGNHLPHDAEAPLELRMLPQHQIDPFFEAVAEGVEEAILNALVAAETMTGLAGRTAYALPHEELRRLVAERGILS